MRPNTFRMITVLVMLSMVAALIPATVVFAEDADVTLATVLRQQEPITQYSVDSSQIPTLDPQLATDNVSINPIENLFLGLVDVDPYNPNNLNPELATDWSSTDDELVWTFNIRTDVPWVQWDPVADEATVLRMVTAGDIEFGIKRACDPRLLSQYGDSTVRGVVAGCDDALSISGDEFTDEDLDLTQVVALDDATLQITLNFAAGYFLSQTAMWVYRPVHAESLAEYGDNWTEPGNMVTNGPFVMDEWVRGVRRVFVRNPHLPADLAGPGNLERKVETVVEDLGTQFALYLDGQIDSSGIPTADFQSIVSDPQYADQLVQQVSPNHYYVAFATDKAPFDVVEIRRAFSAAVDRNAFISEVRQGRGIPMIHFTPPGMFGAPPINEVGVGYDPEFAREQLAAGGYPDCAGFPDIEFVAPNATMGAWGEFVAVSAERELGCPGDMMTTTLLEWGVMLEQIAADNPPEDRPNIWAIGWGPDYGDANNWVNDVLYCESAQSDTARPCSEVDDLIVQAAREGDPDTRVELYYRIEEMFFGPEGSYPIIPMYLPQTISLKRPYYDVPFETDGIFGGVHWAYRSINQEEQMMVRGG